MNRRSLVLLLVALALMGATAGLLMRCKTLQRLGPPGLKTSPLPGSSNLLVDLPEKVLDMRSEAREESPVVLGWLPKDTSYGQRLYRAADGFETLAHVVLMGTDRTSIHRPEFCLTGQGWQIDRVATKATVIPIRQPESYDLPVVKLVATRQEPVNGQPVTMKGLYVYWFVTKGRVTTSHWQRNWWMAEELLRTGVLERWAYVSCFSVCEPGQEEATYARMQQFIAAAVPQFQPAPGSSRAGGKGGGEKPSNGGN